MSTEARARLAGAARVLLTVDGPLHEARAAAQALFDLCCQASGFEGGPATSTGDGTRLAGGVAIAPLGAARCILDFARTRCFAQAVAAAIDAARARFGEPVQVLYAGCGPFAPLLFPLTTALTMGAARFTLLDVHAESVERVRRLARAFEAEPWIASAEVADACAWRAPRAPHVIVAEVMQAGLERGPQVALTRALAPQLAPGGFFVPQEVTLTACLADLSREFGLAEVPSRVPLGEVLRLHPDAPPPDQPPAVRLKVPWFDGPAQRALLLTHVRAFGALELRECDSGLTYPKVLAALGLVDPGLTLEFRYRTGPDPRLEAGIVD